MVGADESTELWRHPIMMCYILQQEKMRLEQLKSKSRQEQSAVASPEVKRHLQEFVLQKKRKEAAVGSMSNLKMATATHTAPSTPPHALLRKTASESNLLKMKPGKRSWPGGGAPYQVNTNSTVTR